MDDNPFVDPTDVNPFDNQNLGNKQAAVLEIDDRTDNPFHESQGTSNDLSGTINAATQDLKARQAELDKKEAELRRREAQLNPGSAGVHREKNWPPLPAWSPIKPCIYHDIDMEIPAEYQSTVRKMYHVWLSYVGILLLNVATYTLILFIPNSHSSTPPSTQATYVPPEAVTSPVIQELATDVGTALQNQSQPVASAQSQLEASVNETLSRTRRETDDINDKCKTGHELYQIWLSIAMFCLFAPLSIVWYRAIYKAFREDSSFQFHLFFFVYYFQLIFHIIQALGIDNMGFIGWFQVKTYLGCNIGSGVLAIFPAAGFTYLVVMCFTQMIKIHEVYKSTGKTLAQAHQDLASGIMSNPTVQGYAQEAATDILRQQAGGR